MKKKKCELNISNTDWWENFVPDWDIVPDWEVDPFADWEVDLPDWEVEPFADWEVNLPDWEIDDKK